MRICRTRANYWSNSKLAKWIFKQVNIQYLSSATPEEWAKWHKETKTNHPYVYWFVENFLDKAQNFVNYPLDVWGTFHQWITYSFIKHTSIIDTKLKRGEFHDSTELILHGMFSLLVDYVECEKASMYLWCHKDEPKPWWMKSSLTRWSKYRNPELGLKYLQWEADLGDDGGYYQVITAKETLELYDWWKNIRPNRVDPFVLSGLDEYYKRKENSNKDDDIWTKLSFNQKTEEEVNSWREMSNKQQEIDDQYEQEDTDMLIRLIKIRNGMWT